MTLNHYTVGYKNKTTFVWCTVWQYHFVWGGGRITIALQAHGDPSATPKSVILPLRSPDSGCFALIYIC